LAQKTAGSAGHRPATSTCILRSSMSLSATAAATARYAKRFSRVAAPGHFREAQKLSIASFGIGTYLGQPDDKTDASYAASMVAAGEGGINVVDTAINYRFQRS